VSPALLAAAVCLLLCGSAAGQPAEKLAEGPGAELVQVKCTLCHDTGNITRIRQTREEWEETLKVMERRGAPITPAEAAIILDYLTKHYGK
jgi:cytochrome c5